MLKTLGVAIGKRSANGADRKGTDLLKGFQLIELIEQMRAADDASATTEGEISPRDADVLFRRGLPAYW